MSIDVLTFTCNWLMIFKFCLTSLKFVVINVHLLQNHLIVIRFLKNGITCNFQHAKSLVSLFTTWPPYLKHLFSWYHLKPSQSERVL